jgi:hypothetical protein
MGFCSASEQRRASFVAPRDGILKNLFVFPSQLPNEADGEVTVTVIVNNAPTPLQAIYSVDVQGLNPASNTDVGFFVTQGAIITTLFESTGDDMTNAANFQTNFVFE